MIQVFDKRALIHNLSYYSYSGTTWVQEIIWQIYNEAEISRKPLMQRVPFLERVTAKHFPPPDLKTLPSPRLMKSHLPYSTVPKGENEDTQCKYIYIARNPKDVAVSFFRFYENRNAIGNGYNGPWKFFLNLFLDGKGEFVLCLGFEPF